MRQSSGFRPRCRTVMNSTKHYLCDIQPVLPPSKFYWNTTSCLILAHWPLATKTWCHPQPEVFNISQHFQRRTESWPHVTCTNSLVKIGHIVFKSCKWTDKQTYMLITKLCTPPGESKKLASNDRHNKRQNVLYDRTKKSQKWSSCKFDSKQHNRIRNLEIHC